MNSFIFLSVYSRYTAISLKGYFWMPFILNYKITYCREQWRLSIVKLPNASPVSKFGCSLTYILHNVWVNYELWMWCDLCRPTLSQSKCGVDQEGYGDAGIQDCGGWACPGDQGRRVNTAVSWGASKHNRHPLLFLCGAGILNFKQGEVHLVH